MECVPGAWVFAAGEMGRILLTEGSSKGYSLGDGHLCMRNNYEGFSCFSISPHRYGHMCMCNSYCGGDGGVSLLDMEAQRGVSMIIVRYILKKT